MVRYHRTIHKSKFSRQIARTIPNKLRSQLNPTSCIPRGLQLHASSVTSIGLQKFQNHVQYKPCGVSVLEHPSEKTPVPKLLQMPSTMMQEKLSSGGGEVPGPKVCDSVCWCRWRMQMSNALDEIRVGKVWFCWKQTKAGRCDYIGARTSGTGVTLGCGQWGRRQGYLHALA